MKYQQKANEMPLMYIHVSVQRELNNFQRGAKCKTKNRVHYLVVYIDT